MPTIEIMTTKDDDFVNQSRVFNLDNTVGRGGANQQGDVMLIQAIFKAIENEESAFMFLKLKEPTGTIDQMTIRAIWEMQSLSRHSLLSVDGIIHPMKLTGRTLSTMAQRQTLLQMLNARLWWAATSYNGVDFVNWLMDKYPQLHSHVRDMSDRPQV